MADIIKIAIIIGSADISGGTYVIFQHASYLQESGLDVTILCDVPVAPETPLWHDKGATFKYKTIDEAESEEFDIAMATWWVTVYKLHRVNAKTYSFFNQSVESRFYLENDYATRKWADGVYTFNLPIITEASWIQNHIKTYFNRDSQLVLNGIRKDIYQTDGEAYAPREGGKLRVLVEGPLGIFFKNTEKAIELAKQSNADEIWLLTASRNVEPIEGVDRIFSSVKNVDTAKIYRSCDVLVKLSYVEGMFGPPLEIFHCGGTAIIYNVTGHEEYMKNDINSIILDVDDETGVVNSINRLKAEPDYLKRLKAGAIEEASHWPDWETSSKSFLQSVINLKYMVCDTRTDIRLKTEYLTDWSGKHLQVQIAHGELIGKLEESKNENRILKLEVDSLREFHNSVAYSKGFKIMTFLRENLLAKYLRSFKS
jgi:glycosyltransferase involved in cell wall biosynthesis